MRILYTFLLLAISMLAHAQNTIAIYQKDGKVAKFAFTEKPVITYADNNLVLTTSQTSVQYPIYLLQKIDFDTVVTTGVKEVKIDTQFGFQGGVLYISGGEPNSAVYIYNLKGVMEGQYRLDDTGSATIPMYHLKKDIYVVKTTRFSFKISKP